jgi:sialic acid synthase SpsE
MSKEVKIVAEMGASHHQDAQTAKEIIDAAKWAGASAVKVQMFTADQMTLNSKDEKFIIKEGRWKGLKLWDLYDAAALPIEWVPQLKEYTEALGMGFFASVYHPDMVDVAESIGIPIYKIASFEIPYLELIEKVAKTKKPVYISTGMAEYGEIKTIVNLVKKHHKKITLLYCVSEYPPKIEDMNLRTIDALGHSFKVRTGLSDHTEGIVAAVASVPLGVTVIEKHIRVDDISLDNFAIMPETFRVMVKTVRAAEQSLGKVEYSGEKKFRREEIEGRWIRTISQTRQS